MAHIMDTLDSKQKALNSRIPIKKGEISGVSENSKDLDNLNKLLRLKT